MRTILLPHNKTAYQKVMRAFETSRMTCVCHPTGTGKSYIVAAVSEHFKKVLVLAPNIFVLNQQRSVLTWKKDVDYMTYSGLMFNVCDMTKQYDLIVLDEFHRTGADEWGAAVRLLIDSQPEAKVLGTTATPIRYLDGERDMAVELFGGNIASQLSIAEAWSRGNILPIPTYVTGIFNFDKTIADGEERIRKSYRLNDKQKREHIFKLSNAKLDWEQSSGMVRILRRHLDPQTRRMIVFCPVIERLEPMKQQVCQWLRQAGFTIAAAIIMHSRMTELEQREAMDDFESDEGDGIRIIFSVNILNEGVHVPRVGAVLMLRTTASRIVYMQQLGRALTTANTEKPLVLDMVDNLTTTTAIGGFAEEFERLELERVAVEGGEPRRFEVVDYTQSVRDVVKKLVPEEYSHLGLEERLVIIQAYVREHDDLPTQKEYNEYRHWTWLNINYHDDERVVALRHQYRRLFKIEDKVKRVSDFFEANGRFPRKSVKSEQKIAVSWTAIKKKYCDHPLVIELVQREQAWLEAEKERWMKQAVIDVRAFCEQHDRVPVYNRHDKLASVWMRLRKEYPTHPDVLDIASRYTKAGRVFQISLEDRIRMVEDECRKTGYLPRACNNRQISHIWHTLQRNHPDHPDVKRIAATYKPYPYVSEVAKKNIAEVVAFCEEHHRRPFYGDGKSIYGKWYHIIKTYPNLPEVARLIAEYKDVPIDKTKTVEARAAKVMEYYEAHRDFPHTGTSLYNLWSRLRKYHGDHPDVQRLIQLQKQLPKNIPSIRKSIKRYQQYLAEHGQHAAGYNDPETTLWKNIRKYADYFPEIQAIIDQYGWTRTKKNK